MLQKKVMCVLVGGVAGALERLLAFASQRGSDASGRMSMRGWNDGGNNRERTGGSKSRGGMVLVSQIFHV
jgi:hypothetical protein